jgi:hypothetical protein
MKSLPAFACVLLALAAGCSSSGNKAGQSAASTGGATAGPRLSTADFIKRGNAICTAYYKKLNKLPQPTNQHSLAQAIRHQSGYLEQTLAQLDRLRPPASDERTFAEMISTVRSSFPLLSPLIGAIARGEKAAVQRFFAKGDAIDARANQLAAEIGLYVCAQPTPQVPSGKG